MHVYIHVCMQMVCEDVCVYWFAEFEIPTGPVVLNL